MAVRIQNITPFHTDHTEPSTEAYKHLTTLHELLLSTTFSSAPQLSDSSIVWNSQATS